MVSSGRVRSEPNDIPEGACFIGKPFTADVVHGHNQDILSDCREQAPLRQREVTETVAPEVVEILTTHLRNRRRFPLEP